MAQPERSRRGRGAGLRVGWLLTLLATASLALAVQAADAAEPTPTPQTGALVRVAPVHVRVPPGLSEYAVDFELANPSSVPQQLTASAVELSLDGRQLPRTVASADRWVSIDPKFAPLPPGERRSFHVTVHAPVDREPGERRIGIVFLARSTPASGASGIESNIALVPSVWIPGSGPVIERVAIRRLTGPLFTDWSPVSFDLEIANLGNVHQDFGYGSLAGAPQLTGSTSTGDHFRFPALTLLPNRSATVRGVWTRPPPVCWCEVTVETIVGGATVTSRTHLLILPFRISFGLLIAAVGLSFLLRTLRRRATARRLAAVEAARQEGIRIGRGEQ